MGERSGSECRQSQIGYAGGQERVGRHYPERKLTDQYSITAIEVRNEVAQDGATFTVTVEGGKKIKFHIRAVAVNNHVQALDLGLNVEIEPGALVLIDRNGTYSIVTKEQADQLNQSLFRLGLFAHHILNPRWIKGQLKRHVLLWINLFHQD